jgi:hypothetical protein
MDRIKDLLRHGRRISGSMECRRVGGRVLESDFHDLRPPNARTRLDLLCIVFISELIPSIPLCDCFPSNYWLGVISICLQKAKLPGHISEPQQRPAAIQARSSKIHWRDLNMHVALFVTLAAIYTGIQQRGSWLLCRSVREPFVV